MTVIHFFLFSFFLFLPTLLVHEVSFHPPMGLMHNTYPENIQD